MLSYSKSLIHNAITQPTNETSANSQPINNCNNTIVKGQFYCKPKDEECFINKKSKRHKAKLKRDQRIANKVKEIAHPPDVIAKFSQLSILPPKTTNEVPNVLESIEEKLKHYQSLTEIELKKKQKDDSNDVKVEQNKNDTAVQKTDVESLENSHKTDTSNKPDIPSLNIKSAQTPTDSDENPVTSTSSSITTPSTCSPSTIAQPDWNVSSVSVNSNSLPDYSFFKVHATSDQQDKAPLKKVQLDLSKSDAIKEQLDTSCTSPTDKTNEDT